jgi:predicted transcriptional regulator
MNWWEIEICEIEDAIRLLREARRFLNDSARALARALSVCEDTVRNWEMERTKPRLSPHQREFLFNYVREAQRVKRLQIEYRALMHARIPHAYPP